MGLGSSANARKDVATIKSRDIDKQLERDRSNAASVKKLLLLGEWDASTTYILDVQNALRRERERELNFEWDTVRPVIRISVYYVEEQEEMV